MTNSTRDIAEALSALPPEERMDLALALLDSLPEAEWAANHSIDEAVVQLINDRDHDLSSGAVSAISHSELMTSVHKALGWKSPTTRP